MIDVTTDQGRPINMLLNIYNTPQKGEPDTARHYTKKEQRLYERLRYTEYVIEELNIKPYTQRVKHIIINIDNLKDLCRRCKWETIITAIAFYIKTYYNSNCKINHIDRYKICKDNNLTLTKYSTIITRLSVQFQTVKALSPLCPIK